MIRKRQGISSGHSWTSWTGYGDPKWGNNGPQNWSSWYAQTVIKPLSFRGLYSFEPYRTQMSLLYVWGPPTDISMWAVSSRPIWSGLVLASPSPRPWQRCLKIRRILAFLNLHNLVGQALDAIRHLQLPCPVSWLKQFQVHIQATASCHGHLSPELLVWLRLSQGMQGRMLILPKFPIYHEDIWRHMKTLYVLIVTFLRGRRFNPWVRQSWQRSVQCVHEFSMSIPQPILQDLKQLPSQLRLEAWVAHAWFDKGLG